MTACLLESGSADANVNANANANAELKVGVWVDCRGCGVVRGWLIDFFLFRFFYSCYFYFGGVLWVCVAGNWYWLGEWREGFYY